MSFRPFRSEASANDSSSVSSSNSGHSGRSLGRKARLTDRQRKQRLRTGRRLLSETLEVRQVFAGPELVAIQPNEGELLVDGTVLSVSPRELVFRFDDDTRLDPATLGAIRLTRAGDDGVFESASATTDLGTGDAFLLEFRARAQGIAGNGTQVVFTSSNRAGSALPLLSVNGRTVTVDLNNNPSRASRIADLISAIQNNAAANAILEVISVSGSTQTVLGGRVANGTAVRLIGANSAEGVIDFGNVSVRFVSTLSGVDGRGTRIELEKVNFGGAANPVIITTENVVRIQLNSTPNFETTAAQLIARINSDAAASAVVTAVIQDGSPTTVIGNTNILAPLTLTGVTDVVVAPGYVGLGDAVNEVVFRFAEPLPDDIYQLDILATGPSALQGTGGLVFNNGVNFSRRFAIDLGPKVLAVVPEPIRQNVQGQLQQPARGQIDVHFNERLDAATATNRDFYQLIYTRDTVDNRDDVVVRPASVSYNANTNIATLQFSSPIGLFRDNNNEVITGAARLRIGSADAIPAAPTQVALATEPGDTLESAFNLATGAVPWTISQNGISSAIVSSRIQNERPFDLNLPGPDVAGVRNTRSEDPTRREGSVPLDYVRRGADLVDGITTLYYDFATTWLGDDPRTPTRDSNRTYFNSISEQQKQRVRESFELFSQYLGVNFIEVESVAAGNANFTIAVGDLYGVDPALTSGRGGQVVGLGNRQGILDGAQDLVVLDFQDFDQSIDGQFGGTFFRGAMFAVGQVLGYGFADDLPQPVTQSTNFVLNPGTANEAVFPAPVDVFHGQYMYRPDSTDVDLYRFEVPSAGEVRIETLAERLPSASLLNSKLRLYQQIGSDLVEVAANDDYFSNDSFIKLNVTPGVYVLGVSASGNDSYNPMTRDSGFGGLSQGDYQVRFEFHPTTSSTILDADLPIDTDGDGLPNNLPATALDGDGDNRPGGVFNFWFVPSNANNTIFVNKLPTGTPSGLLGSFNNPYRELDLAIAAADAGDTIHVLPNGGADGLIETLGDNLSYQIGFGNNGVELADGSRLELPKDVRMVIDSGAIMKLSRARIGVGSVAPTLDLSNTSLQVLGTPSFIKGTNGVPVRNAAGQIIPGSVYFTSINDRTMGTGNQPQFFAAAQEGDWGGIDFRGELDTADENRRNRENEGVFLNHIQYGDFRYGGGSVSVGGRQTVISPIEMEITRPTIINSRITLSADAAMAASPDTFAESRFTTSQFQSARAFTLDYDRVGPSISGNFIDQNSINGLFVRVDTLAGTPTEVLTTTARFDDTDIVHVLTENLVINGTAGGPVQVSRAPSALLVRLAAQTGGSVPVGTYVYRLTNVDSTGLETAASRDTLPVTLTQVGSVALSDVPAAPLGSGITSRRLYRATVDPVTGLPGVFRRVDTLNATQTSYVDRAAAGDVILQDVTSVLRSRLDATLTIDAGTVVKMDGNRIEARFGANFIAEGVPSLPVVISSLEDQRYGAGGTFDTNKRGDGGVVQQGQWGGIYVGQGASASLDNVVLAGGGGQTRIEGGFASFNVVEVHQADFRIANSRIENNDDGTGPSVEASRVGRGLNDPGTLFVRGSTPIVINNKFVDNASGALSFDVNSMSAFEVLDSGRQTGRLGASATIGNSGPLIENNILDNNSINGLIVRGGTITTESVWDDVGIVHVVNESIEVPNRHIFGGLRLQSDARGSLVVKFQSGTGENAGIVAGGSLLSAADQFRDIADRIGGSLQIIGSSDFPVILTALADDSVGSGFDLNGRPLLDTNNDRSTDTDGNGVVGLPTGPEVNNGLLIDNDVDQALPGFFQASILSGNVVGTSGVTVQDLNTQQILVAQDYIFAYSTFVETSTGFQNLAATTITQPATLIANDIVESRGTFVGRGGTVNWIATSSFRNGIATLFSRLDLVSATGGALGAIRVVSYLDEDIDGIADDVLVTSGTPGDPDFRAYTLDGPRRVGFAHGGFYTPDGDNLVGATYAGWAADQFNQLQTAIVAGTQAFTVAGNIDLVDLPPANGAFGPEDVTTAFAWDVDATARSATVTSFLELLAADPAAGPVVTPIERGLWTGVTIREGAADRNVAAIVENEASRTSITRNNDTPALSQFLGELAPNLNSGDENRRLGFIVDGSISARNDLDVFTFLAQSGTEVWFDIDKTSHALDTVLELVDSNGRVIFGSNDSVLGETNGTGAIGTPTSLYYNGSLPGINADDILPLKVLNGSESIQQFTFNRSIDDNTDLTLTIEVGGVTATIPVAQFLADPDGSLEVALENAFPSLGDVGVTNFRSPNGDLVLQVRFDDQRFATSSAPTINMSVTNVPSTRQVLRIGDQVQDAYTTNRKDAGFRVKLPGEIGTRNFYHIRVRSASTNNPLDSTSLPDPLNPALGVGLSTGNYELQIRLQEADEHAGTLIQKANVRYAQTGLQVIGGPLHSQLSAEEYETTADNSTIATAQPLGYFDNAAIGEANPLASDRLAKAFSGVISSATDVDFYQFTLNYDYLTNYDVSQYLSTVFDLDYAGGLGRADMALYVFNSDGELILIGDNGNVSDDLPQGDNQNLLPGGSLSPDDPYIGATELLAGTYYVAVTNASQLPPQLSQFFDAGSNNPLLRLEPIRSTRRIVEDRIVRTGDTQVVVPGAATQTVLFDDNSIVPYTLDDLVLYVNTAGSLHMVNPFTGQRYGTVGNFGDEIQEVAFARSGEMFGYSGFAGRGQNDDSWFYYEISPETAALSAPLSQGAGIQTFEAIVDGNSPTGFTAQVADVGMTVEAVAIAAFNGVERGYFVANRNAVFDAPSIGAGAQYTDNVLYEFVPSTGLANGPNVNFVNTLSGAATSPREIGRFNTDIVDVGGQGPFFNVLGLTGATRLTGNGDIAPILTSGDFFTIADIPDINGVRDEVRFEFTTDLTITADGSDIVRDQQSLTVSANGSTFFFEIESGERVRLGNAAAQGQTQAGLIQPGSIVIVGEGAAQSRFEFIRSLTVGAQPGNIPILMVNALNQPLTGPVLANALATAINQNVTGARAVVSNDEVFFVGGNELEFDSTGQGITILGDIGVNSAARPIRVDETVTTRGLIQAIANAITGASPDLVVEVSGEQLALLNPGATITLQPGDSGVTPPLIVSLATVATPGSEPIPIQPGDSVVTIAQRVVTAINDATGLDDVTATAAASGRSITINNGSVIQVGSVSNTLRAGGATRGGQITGVDVVQGNQLYAVTDEGELYVVGFGQLASSGARTIGQLVTTATDLIGIPFEGLSVGPSSYQNGELRQILFGITGAGDIYAFNTLGELQPIFAGGESMISTGVGGARGLDFSTLATNLWHFTGTRGADEGHGANATDNETRTAVPGQSSIAFTYEEAAFSRFYLPGEDPTGINRTYNLPGGAKGAIESNVFSMEGYSAADQPYLYFNYFLNTDRGDSIDGPVDIDGDGRFDGDTDSLRVFLVAEDGTQHLLATNNTATGPGASDDEYDDPSPLVGPYDDTIDVNVQRLFDSTGTWRQARVGLGDFAGRSNLRLRIEFATSGQSTGSASLRTIAASQLVEGQTFSVANLPFAIDFAPAATVPSGSELAAFYTANPASRSTVSVNGKVYVLNDGSRTIGADEVSVALASSLDGLRQLSASDLATLLAEAVSANPPTLAVGTLTVTPFESTVEFQVNGGDVVILSTGLTDPIRLSGQQPVNGISVPLGRGMSAIEVAGVVQQVLANELLAGNLSLIPQTNSSIRLAGLTLDDPGPFADESERYGNQFGGGVLAGAVDNNHEGAYLDDFIIGFAERGETVTSSGALGTQTFVTDGRFQFPNPPEPPVGATTGSYTVEIRDASEYAVRQDSELVTSTIDTRFRVFDTNDRLGDGISFSVPGATSIRDGQSFTIDNGREQVLFEFDLLSETGQSSGTLNPTAVPIPYRLSVLDPATNQLRPQNDFEIAGAVITAINREDVRDRLGAFAAYSSGAPTQGDARIHLFGNVEINDDSGALTLVDRSFRRGDSNREREQGVIIVEQSQFAFNSEYGVVLAGGETATINGNETNSIVRYPRNFQELNTEQLRPGVVVRSNVMAFNDVGGLRIEGIADASLNGANPATFDRVLNNTIVGGQIESGVQSPPGTFGGMLFPQGTISFADTVVSYQPDVGGAGPAAVHRNDARALGAPDSLGRGAEPVDGQFTVSLGLGGTLTLAFTNNLLTGSGDTNPDLVIFETGTIESVRVEISRDGVNFFNVGNVGGSVNTIDIDRDFEGRRGFGPQDRFGFVRLTDLRQGATTGASLGADIDAVGALSSVPVQTFTAGGTGITITGNASPTLLNNIVANSATAIEFGTNPGAVLGANTFYRNDALATGQTLDRFSQVISPTEVIFARPEDLIFTPLAGAPTIDSSIDSLNDRASLVTLKSRLGISDSPILAPEFDINGLQRTDDPKVEPPNGLGSQVFKDRGADDRGDLVGPRAVLLSPQAPDIGLSAGSVTVSRAPRFFEIQFIDGLAPADVTPGTGIDDNTVNSGSLLVIRDNVPLVEGVDYRFGYNPTDNVIRLTPVAGVWEENSTYVIRIIDGSDAIVRATEPLLYTDGDILQMRTTDNRIVRFEYERGITLTISDAVRDVSVLDSTAIEIYDGTARRTFELDTNSATNAINTAVPIALTATKAEVAIALAAAINVAGMNLTATAVGSVVQLSGVNPLSTAVSSSVFVTSAGRIGTSSGFGFQIPNEDNLVADTLIDGQTFVIRRGTNTVVTFEFDNNNVITTPGATRVPFTTNQTLDSLAAELVRLIGGAGIGLAPQNAGFGRVFLGGDQTYSISLEQSVLTPIDLAGQGPTIPVSIRIGDEDTDIATKIAAAIRGVGIAGVQVSQVDTRLYIDGVNGVFGVGAVATTTVADKVGNLLQSNRSDGRTELTVFIGGGFDYGDAPGSYITALADNGPRHGLIDGFSLGTMVSPEADALRPNLDIDDGVVIPPMRNGFASNVIVNVNVPTNQTLFYLDAWFDWNGNGVFETSEKRSFGSVGTGRSRIDRGNNILTVDVPSNAIAGEIYARFRLSGQDNLESTGNAIAGEVEDYSIIVAPNAFQNAIAQFDVNGSGNVTPLDALQVINFMRRLGSAEIDLQSDSLPINRPPFPDVSGDGLVTPLDALLVINQLRRTRNTPGGESNSTEEAAPQLRSLLSTFTPVADGVLASAMTVLTNPPVQVSTSVTESAPVPPTPSSISVFDHPAVIELDQIVDTLARDKTENSTESNDSISAVSDINLRDDFFASL